VTLYEAENASGLANGRPFPSLGLRDKPAQNADGSTDLYLGPKALLQGLRMLHSMPILSPWFPLRPWRAALTSNEAAPHIGGDVCRGA
jgi:hypothetical protein